MGIKRHSTGLVTFTLLIGLIFSFTSSRAQEITQDTSLIERDGRLFYRYVVEPGNTLYYISKQYDISVQEIQEHNPKSKKELSIGDTLYILSVHRDKKSIEKKLEVDGNIIVHEVQKKQTMYAISKIYGISVGDIMEVNPEIKKGLKTGQLVKIPISKLKEEEPEREIDEELYISHEVQSKETFYSLSKLYNVPIDSIKQANDGLPEGLKVGQVIAIPKKDQMELESDSSIIKDVYNVAFILPLFLDMNDTLMSNLKMDDKKKIFPKSLVSLQFYEGAQLAIDSLINQGLKFNIKYYDSAKDTNVINDILEKGFLKDVDLIIGPFYLSQFIQVSTYAAEHKIHIVCPVPQNNKVLLGNSYVSKVATSRNIIFKNLGKSIAHLYKTQNIIIVGKNYRANPLSFAFKNEFLNTLEKSDDTLNVANLKEVKWDKGSVDPIRLMLKDSMYNIIVVPSSNQVYVTELLTKLNSLSEDYGISVVGQDQWLRYSNIDFDYFEHLSVIIPVDGYVNYDRPEVQDFIEKYNKRYKMFPEKYAFQGFDIAYFYLNLLYKEGNRIEPALLKADERKLYFNFEYFKTGIESGYENSSTVLLRYEDYKLQEVPVIIK